MSDAHKRPAPPAWADRFLQWYCRPDLLEEIQGDAHELFQRKARKNLRVARWQYVWNVFRFFRLRNIRRYQSPRFTHTLAMIKSYLISGLRNAARNLGTTLINVSGLALGVAGAITIFIYVDQFYHTDDAQEKRDRIYQVTNTIHRDKEDVILSDVPILLAPSMQSESPAIESIVRIELGSGSVRAGDRVFAETLHYVDPSFFTIFNYPFLAGSTRVFQDKNAVVITSVMQEKYFGSQEALGKNITIKFPNNEVREFVIGAVVDPPANNTLYFSFLVSMEVFEDLKIKNTEHWDYLTDGTYLLLKEGHRIDEVAPLMNKYQKLQNASSPEWMIVGFQFYPFTSLSARSYEIESALFGSGAPEGPLSMLIIATLVMLLACFNYMNISLATLTTRVKEIGVRRVIGGRRQEIIQQFMIENAMLCMLALLMGYLVAWWLFMPWLNQLLQYKIPFEFSSPWMSVYFLGGLFLLIILVSGVYPALYISRFQPITILKGKEKFGQRSTFSRILLTVQFMLAIITIVGAFVLIDNNIYLQSKDWGYDHEQNLVVPVNSYEQYLQVRDFVADEKNVLASAGSTNHIGYWNPRSVVENRGERFEIVAYNVGFDYMETMNLRLVEGRFFDATIQSDQVESVIVNENFVSTMGWTKGVNQVFEYDSIKRVVIGVVKNFHYDEFYRGILPVMFTVDPVEKHRYVSLRVAAGKLNETEALMKEAWKKIAPDDPYKGIIQDDVFENMRHNNEAELKLLGFVAVVTVTLACLGLLGLVSYNITRRMKEFSVRKVFGASVSQIFKLMNRDYVWMLSIAFGLGAPVGYWFMNILLESIYFEHEHTSLLPIVIAVVVMLVTVLGTVATQVKRILRENPADTLRSE